MVSPAAGSVVAVTGSSGYIGSHLLQKLEEKSSLARLIAVDVRPPSMPIHNVDSHRLDLTKPLNGLFQGPPIDTVVHLAFNLREGRTPREAQTIQTNNLLGLENLLRGCRMGKVKNFVYLSSHTVYGAHADNPVPITEEAPFRPLMGFQYSVTKAMSEEMLRRFAEENPQVGVTILRCCMVLGLGGVNHVARALQKPLLIKIAGCDPPLQFIHVRDLVQVLSLFSVEPTPGVFNVAGDGVVRYSRMAKIMGQRALSLPRLAAYPLVHLTWKLRLQREAAASGLDFIRHPIIMATGRVKQATGYRFRYTSEEAVSSFAALEES